MQDGRRICVDVGNKFFIKASLLRSQSCEFFVVKRNAQFFSNQFTDLFALRTMFAGNGDDYARLGRLDDGFRRHFFRNRILQATVEGNCQGQNDYQCDEIRSRSCIKNTINAAPSLHVFQNSRQQNGKRGKAKNVSDQRSGNRSN